MGFFNLGPMPIIEKKPKGTGCTLCGQDRSGLETGFIGECQDGILILGAWPVTGEALPFESPFWRHLFSTEGKRGLPTSWKKSAALGYALGCPHSKPDYSASHALCCKFRLDKLIKDLRPRVIIPLGIVATEALIFDRLSGRISGTQASDFYGKQIPDRNYNAWICPTYDPEYLLRCEDREFKPDLCPILYFESHLRSAYGLINKELPEIPTDIVTSQDVGVIAATLLKIQHHEIEVSIDYETTGLKPHREGHRIICASIAWRDQQGLHAFGFRWYADNVQIITLWEAILQDPKIGKIAHKADYEACWTHFRAGKNNGKSLWPVNWSWDTCVGAHCLDNNQKVGLKFQTYCELGVLGYDSQADKWISSYMPGEDPKSANAFNLLASPPEMLPWDDLLYYCAQDSLYTLFLRHKQEPEFSPGQLIGFRFFMEGTETFAKVQSGGLPYDIQIAPSLHSKMTAKYEEARAKVLGSKEAAQWPASRPAFNPDSNQQLVELLYTILKIKSPAEKPNAQEASLSKIDTEFTRTILEMRHWARMRDTFLAGYAREAAYDADLGQYVIRPFFNLATGADDGVGGPRTFRSSADSPNFQNIPKRDKEMKALLRSCFRAPPGFKFVEWDYKSVEVIGSACYHKDPNMIKYLIDPTSDMHRDTACDMFFRTPETLAKIERQNIKRGYVFSSFYGATAKHCAEIMWADMPADTRKWVAEHTCTYWDRATRREVTKKIRSPEIWLEHVKKVDKIFWGERFGVYNQWRQDEWDRYQKYGYVETYTGFRCYGPMGFTEATNRCIQGTSFHIMLRALSLDVKDFEAHNLESRIIGQIHDAIVGLVKDGEDEIVDQIIYKNGVERVRAEWPWIVVPLTIEKDASESGGIWAEMKSFGALQPSL